MKKNLIALAVAGALAGTATAASAASMADVEVSGFADIYWFLSDENFDTATGNPVDGQFAVPEVEVDFKSGGVRIDIDNFGGAFRAEQANFTTELAGGWSLTAGTFESGLTDDEQDVTDMNFVTHSQLFTYVQSTIGADILAGAAVSGKAGPVDVTIGYVNDPKAQGAAATDSENSVLLRVSGDIPGVNGLGFEFGYLSLDDAHPNAVNQGGLTDINFNYTMNQLMVGFDYLMGDPKTGTGAFDTGYTLMAGYDLGNGFNIKARFESWENDGAADSTDANAVWVGYALSDNVDVAFEASSVDPAGTASSKSVNQIELIAHF